MHATLTYMDGYTHKNYTPGFKYQCVRENIYKTKWQLHTLDEDSRIEKGFWNWSYVNKYYFNVNRIVNVVYPEADGRLPEKTNNVSEGNRLT